MLTTTGQWVLLWNSCFDILKIQSIDVKKSCLQVIRILSRDKTYLNETIKDEQFESLLELANLGAQQKSQELDNTSIVAEAMKCLCNLLYQSKKCQVNRKSEITEFIYTHIRSYDCVLIGILFKRFIRCRESLYAIENI